MSDSENSLTNDEFTEIVNNDEFWEDDESVGNGDNQSENSENKSLQERNRLQACNDIFL